MSKEYVRDEYPFRNITQEEADLLCAKHVLWLHGQGGEQANFEGCSLSYLDLSHRNFAGASFRGSRIYETDLRHSRLDAADFTDAVITGGDLRYSSAQKALFRNTVLDRCLCLYTCFRESDFSGARMQTTITDGSDWAGCRLEGCVFQDTFMDQVIGKQDSLRLDEQDGGQNPGPAFS